MKKLIFFILAYYGSAFACQENASTNNVVVMYDLNFVFDEIRGAKEAACKRGEKLIVLPGGYEEHKRVGLIREESYRANEAYKRCYKKNRNEVRTKCKSSADKKNALNRKYRDNSNNVNKVNLSQDMKNLASKGYNVKSLILSGHDGSGSFHGHAGRLKKKNIVASLQEAYKNKPELLEELHSVYLWGCYTTTKAEVIDWQQLVPSLKVIAGFKGSGPSIGKEASRRILKDLMSKERDIANIKSRGHVERALKNLDALSYMWSGIYVRTCNENSKEEGHYLVNTKKKTTGGGRGAFRIKKEFSPFDIKECLEDSMVEEFKVQHALFQKYFEGEVKIPEDTSNGKIREIYNFYRKNEHCSQVNDKLSKFDVHPDRVGLLLFFEGVKENFFDNFKKTLAEAESAFAQFGELESELEKSLEEDYKLPESKWYDFVPAGRFTTLGTVKKNKRKKILKDKEQAKKDLAFIYDLKKKNLPTKREDFLKLTRKELLDINVGLNKIGNSPLANNPKYRNQMRKINNLGYRMEQYLYQVSNRCMDFLAWHERVEGEDPARPRC